jgi:P-type conjugative transfer protein TrbJ
MTRVRFPHPLLAGAAALSLLAVAPPAQAQLTVYDPSNYAQAVLQASRALQQINNQITGLQNQASMLINQARNLTSLPTNTLSQIRQSMDRTHQLISQAQQIAYNVQDIDRVFDQRYPAGSLSGTGDGQLVANAEARWHDAVGSFQDSLRTQAGVVTNLGDTRAQIDTLVGASQDATGALQAAQAGNQLVALQTRQLADLTALMAAQGRAASIAAARAAARAAADEAQGRERRAGSSAPSTTMCRSASSCSMTEPEQDRPAGRAGWRPTALRWRGIALAAAAATIGFAALIGLHRPSADPSRYSVVEGVPAPSDAPADPLRAELLRCRSLPANVDDARCRAAWEVNHRRFMGESRSLILPTLPAAPSGEAAPAAPSDYSED